MTEPAKPALTPAQWADINGPMFCYGAGADAKGRRFVYFAGDVGEGIHISRTAHGDDPQDALFPVELPAEDRHGLAAIALYDQPFGFTQEDVRLLRETISPLWDTGVTESHRQQRAREDAAYESLADRISALLPPEKPA
jgi:hypothetical protein